MYKVETESEVRSNADINVQCVDRLLKVRKKLGTCHELVALMAKLLSAEHRTSTVNKRPPTIAAVPQKKTTKKGEGKAYRLQLDSRDWGGGTSAGRGARSNRNNALLPGRGGVCPLIPL
jgi:hypothetical protein